MAVMPASRLFAAEEREAERLGFTLQARVDTGTGGHTAYALLVPADQRALHACRTAAAMAGHAGMDAIEVRQTYQSPDVMALALSEAINAALDRAREVLA